MKEYKRVINYYETDQMGVVHHSNYFRYFEEARTSYMEQSGYPYKRLEEEKIVSPVVAIDCKYKRSIRYGETVIVKVKIVSLTKIRCAFSYEIVSAENGEVKAVGNSEHCFLDESGKVVAINKAHPDFFELYSTLVEEA